jgi:hypothetical protein
MQSGKIHLRAVGRRQRDVGKFRVRQVPRRPVVLRRREIVRENRWIVLHCLTSLPLFQRLKADAAEMTRKWLSSNPFDGLFRSFANPPATIVA